MLTEYRKQLTVTWAQGLRIPHDRSIAIRNIV